MSLIKRYASWQFDPKRGKDRPVPQKGIRRFFYLLINYFWKLVFINLLFLLCCIPIITIPAAFCALNRYLIKMVRTGYGFDLSDYWKEFRMQIWKSVPFGVLTGLLIFYGFYLLSYSPEFLDTSKSMLTGMIAWICLMGASLIGSYVFVLLPMLELKNKNILKNAVILMLWEWKASLLTLLVTFSMGFMILALFPYSIVLLLLNWFSITQLMLCSILNPVISKRIINPYMEQNS